MPLRSPYPYPGGKSRVALDVWDRLGNPPYYVEPFFGSGALLLARPDVGAAETVNDADGMITNFWRAIAAAPAKVAEWADWPINELDLCARHDWLREQKPGLIERLVADPRHFDAKIAGWWVWGICQWIGSGWCSAQAQRKRPRTHSGNGVVAKGNLHQLKPWFQDLCSRLRAVRILCGDFERTLSLGSTVSRWSMTGVFLDPPYDTKRRTRHLYTCDDDTAAGRAQAWCLEHGKHPKLRIALCGLEGEHAVLEGEGWSRFDWTRLFGTVRSGTAESIWFSPHCLKPSGQLELFGGVKA